MGLPFFNRGMKRRDQIVSIDLGGCSTKAIYLQRKGDRFSLQNYVIMETPSSDRPLTAEALASHLKNVIRQIGSGRNKHLTLAIGGPETVFRQVDMPWMPVGDMRQMLKFNSKNYLQQDLTDYVFDCCYLATPVGGKVGEPVRSGGPGQKHKVAVGGVKKNVLNELQEAIKELGMIADQVVPGLIGPVNAFEISEPEVFNSEVVALVDIGFRNTSITILDCGQIILNRVVALGGDRLTSGLGESMGISYAEAENIKVGMTSEVRSTLELIINPLGRELRASLDFFEHQQDKPVSQVYLSGGTSQNDIILELVQNELMVPCKGWVPTLALETGLPPEKLGELEQAAPKLTVAVGAAAAGF